MAFFCAPGHEGDGGGGGGGGQKAAMLVYQIREGGYILLLKVHQHGRREVT